MHSTDGLSGVGKGSWSQSQADLALPLVSYVTLTS